MPAYSVIDYDCWYDILTFNSLHLGQTKLISRFWFVVWVNFSWADVISIQREATVLSIILHATRCIILVQPDVLFSMQSDIISIQCETHSVEM